MRASLLPLLLLLAFFHVASTAEDDSERTANRFLTYFTSAIELRDEKMLRELIAYDFYSFTCDEKMVVKPELIDFIMIQPNGSSFRFDVFSTERYAEGMVDVRIDVQGFDGKQTKVALLVGDDGNRLRLLNAMQMCDD